MPLGMEVRLGPGHIVLDGDPPPPCERAQQSSPLFDPCLLWPRSPISATAELFFQLQLLIFSAVILPLQLQRELKPNSITLASSELAPNMFGASSELASNMFGASSGASSQLVRS